MQIKITREELAKKKVFIGMPCYGGMMCGMTAKSLLDLQATLSQYNIDSKFSFLFNESLIQRARNYIADEFLNRSDCTHLMFIDSDIAFNPQDVIAMLALDKDIAGGPYPKKSYANDTIVETEDGPKKIKWIVDNKYTGKVLCMNHDTMKFEWKNIISHSVDPGHSSKKWVKIGRHGRKMLVVTDDHEVAIVNDILFPTQINYIKADQSSDNYIIKKVIKNNKNSNNPLYNSEQISCLIGTLLGDGSIRNGYLGFGHSDNQREFIELKQHLFGGTLTENKCVGSYKGKDYFASFLECPRNAQILELESLLYFDGKNKIKKTLKNVIHLLDEKGLAFWYMDDGSLGNKDTQGYIKLHTNGFSEEDVLLAINYLNDKWGIESKIVYTSSNLPTIQINTENSQKVFSLISKYIPECMEYKLPKKYRGGEKHIFNNEFLDFSAEKVLKVEYINTNNKNSYFRPGKKQYDIGVEDNCNFVANGYLAHNSIDWGQLHRAIKKHPDLPASEYEKLTGSIVFNPVGGTKHFNVTEPLEVSEVGTGFMLIKREVFEKFQESHPEYMYKPDHVGQAHFGGDREICSFFNVFIDPDSKRTLSEDYCFCHQVRKLEMKIWLCPWFTLSHIGSNIFQGSLPAVAQYLGEM